MIRERFRVHRFRGLKVNPEPITIKEIVR